MRCCFNRIVFVSLLAVVWFVSGFSQSAPTTPPRPKVGLVLEGGGALGLAHIGVIQWLEEHRIPVNYVAGTSMGGSRRRALRNGSLGPGNKGTDQDHQLGRGAGRSNSVQELLFSPQAGCGGIPESSGVRPEKRSAVS